MCGSVYQSHTYAFIIKSHLDLLSAVWYLFDATHLRQLYFESLHLEIFPLK